MPVQGRQTAAGAYRGVVSSRGSLRPSRMGNGSGSTVDQGTARNRRWQPGSERDLGRMHPGGFYVSPGFLILYGGESATGERRGVRGNLTTTETRFGGVRYWWECPGCWRRCRVLYAYPVCGRERFACRRCQQLRYYSHNEGPADRLLRRARKCWRRAGSTDGSEPWRKPRWMRWDTFSRLVLEGRKASEAADWMMLASLSAGIASLQSCGKW
jgi:hypothetical protein